MTNEWKMRVAITAWALLVVGVIALSVRQCVFSDDSRFVTVSPGLRDSLLSVEVSGCQRVDYSGFTVWFDTLHHVPACVTYELLAEHLNGSYQRTDIFEQDENVVGCPSPDAYYGTGLHRGHMAPATDLAWDSVAIRQ